MRLRLRLLLQRRRVSIGVERDVKTTRLAGKRPCSHRSSNNKVRPHICIIVFQSVQAAAHDLLVCVHLCVCARVHVLVCVCVCVCE